MLLFLEEVHLEIVCRDGQSRELLTWNLLHRSMGKISPFLINATWTVDVLGYPVKYANSSRELGKHPIFQKYWQQNGNQRSVLKWRSLRNISA